MLNRCALVQFDALTRCRDQFFCVDVQRLLFKRNSCRADRKKPSQPANTFCAIRSNLNAFCFSPGPSSINFGLSEQFRRINKLFSSSNMHHSAETHIRASKITTKKISMHWTFGSCSRTKKLSWIVWLNESARSSIRFESEFLFFWKKILVQSEFSSLALTGKF